MLLNTSFDVLLEDHGISGLEEEGALEFRNGVGTSCADCATACAPDNPQITATESATEKTSRRLITHHLRQTLTVDFRPLRLALYARKGALKRSDSHGVRLRLQPCKEHDVGWASTHQKLVSVHL